jgi:type III secretion system FlhB-like substrate exporter
MTKYTRQAIALAYGKHPVPIITAKGDDDLAQRMIEEAEKAFLFQRIHSCLHF